MGHTVGSQRRAVDSLIHELHCFARTLREEDRTRFQRLLDKPLKHLGSITYASSVHVWAFVLVSIILEQEKRYERLADRYVPEREQTGAMAQNTAQHKNRTVVSHAYIR